MKICVVNLDSLEVNCYGFMGRVIADYKIEIDFNLSSAKDVIRLCGSVHEFIHKINKLIKA